MYNPSLAASSTSLDEQVVRRILEAIETLDYGAVEVTIHDGKVVQIDRRERTRISQARNGS